MNATMRVCRYVMLLSICTLCFFANGCEHTAATWLPSFGIKHRTHTHCEPRSIGPWHGSLASMGGMATLGWVGLGWAGLGWVGLGPGGFVGFGHRHSRRASLYSFQRPCLLT